MNPRSKYTNDFCKEKYDRIPIQIPKGTKQPILDHLQEKGYKSLNSYVQALISADLGVTDLTELLDEKEKADD